VKHSFERIMEILYRAKMVFTRSATTPPKVNRFGDLEHRKHIVGGCLWQIFGAIHTVVTVWEAAESFGQVNNAWFQRFSIRQILWYLNTTTSISEAMKTFGTEFWKFYHKGSFLWKMQKLLAKILGLATSGCHYSAVISDRRKLTTKLTP